LRYLKMAKNIICMWLFHRSSKAAFNSVFRITILVNVLAVVMVFVPGVPLHYRAILSIPNTALNSIMACRVYHDRKLRNVPPSTFDAGLPGSAPSARLLRPTHQIPALASATHEANEVDLVI
jgi:hypothetical protein